MGNNFESAGTFFLFRDGEGMGLGRRDVSCSFQVFQIFFRLSVLFRWSFLFEFRCPFELEWGRFRVSIFLDLVRHH